ncbi:MAG: glycoside hydrolase family 9 protein [Ruminococcus sp.]|nr:glycoside hydrolase family 9 protein [Ruminococcus sp.]
MKLKRFISFLCILAMLTAILVPSVSAKSSVILNSTFEKGTDGWETFHQAGGVCSLSTDNKRLALHVSSVGDEEWSAQVYCIVPLLQNGVYHLSYEISSTTDRTVKEFIQMNSGDYSPYTLKELHLTSEPQKIDYNFTMKEKTDIRACFRFNCGNCGAELPKHTVYIDNVTLELVDDSKVDKPYEPSIITNQIGYQASAKKTVVFKNAEKYNTFSVVNAETGETEYTGKLSDKVHYELADEDNRTGDFSAVTTPGKYYITCGKLDKSYEFEISDSVYDDVLNDTLRMLYLQRCGTAVEDKTFSHKACHTALATVYGTSDKIDVSGGWHDAGDYGRYVVPGAKACADLMYAYLNQPAMFTDSVGIPESGNNIPDILDEVRYELEWMLKMQDTSGGVHHKVTCATFPGYVMPEEETDELFVTPITSTATADFCGAMALACEVYQGVDKEFAESCLKAAENAWTWLENNPDLVYKNPSDIETGEYEDTSDEGERYWAAAQLWRATQKEKYAKTITEVQTGMDAEEMGDYGSIAILTAPDADKTSELYKKAKETIISRADIFSSGLSGSENSPYGVGISTFSWGSNMRVATAGIILGVAYQLTEETKYKNAALGNQNYILGCNPLGICYLTGYGTVSPQHPHHCPSVVKDTPMQGMVVGGVDQLFEDYIVKAYCSNAPVLKRYVDDQESYSTNEIAIYWNSPFIYLLSLTTDTHALIDDVNTDGSGTGGQEITIFLVLGGVMAIVIAIAARTIFITLRKRKD